LTDFEPANLPRELRDQIYSLLISNAKAIRIKKLMGAPFSEAPGLRSKRGSLPYTCKQLYEEVMPVLYSRRPLVLLYHTPTTHAFDAFLATIKPSTDHAFSPEQLLAHLEQWLCSNNGQHFSDSISAFKGGPLGHKATKQDCHLWVVQRACAVKWTIEWTSRSWGCEDATSTTMPDLKGLCASLEREEMVMREQLAHMSGKLTDECGVRLKRVQKLCHLVLKGRSKRKVRDLHRSQELGG
jgi:hypothetical protein